MPGSQRWGAWAFALVVAALVLVAGCAGDDGDAGEDAGIGERVEVEATDVGPAPTVDVPAGEQAEVLEVVDGDTLEVEVGGTEERVRLLGINTPEHDECWFDQAVAGMDQLVAGGTVTLVSGDRDRDQFGRLLRYVYADGVFVDAEQARRGNAVATSESLAPQAQVVVAEDEARSAERGLWAPDACGEATEDADAVEIDGITADPPGPDEEDLNGEVVILANVGGTDVDVAGWTLQDESSRNRYTFPSGTVLRSDSTLHVRSGCGEDDDRELFWCNDQPVWSNGGDTAFLRDPNGNLVTSAPSPPS